MIYHIGIIDYLQEWNLNKKIEQLLKVTFRGAKKKLLSAVEPSFYRERFLNSVRIVLNFNQENNKKKTMWDEFNIHLEKYNAIDKGRRKITNLKETVNR